MVLADHLKHFGSAANDGRWDTFTMLMGGPQAKRKDFPISIATQWNDKPNRYLEPTGNEIIGIAYGNVVIPTKIHQWTIKYSPERDPHNRSKLYTPANEIPNNGFF